MDSSYTDERWAEFQSEREIGMDIIAKAGLYWVDGGEYDGMLAIPYPKRNGGVWQTRYKTGHNKPKYLDEPGANLHLYNPQFLGPHTPLVFFTEGEIDALVMWEHGYPAIGISGNTKYGTAEFQQAFSLLYSKAIVISIVDNDDAGDVAHNDLVKAFGPKVRRFKLPEGMDVCDYAKDVGHEAFKKEIDTWLTR